ncbi:MAG: low specificity L-threonine aldolase [Planctomycetota bacterium]
MPAVHDFRSDTMTRPTPAMRAAMASAVVGDDVWGEDPTVRELELSGARVLGKEQALLLPSGTMANQVAIHVHCRPGDELLCEERSHVFFYEGGAIARLSGTQVRTLTNASGFPTPQQVGAAVRPDDAHFPRSRLLVLENSHNMAGGRVAAPDRLRALACVAQEHRMLVHMDGARLLNAATALGCAPSELAAPCDSVSLCLSKGLGAPVGSLLAGDAAFVAEARRARKAFGGGMRQAGVLAAAGLLALRDGPALLADDHRRARSLAAGLAALPCFAVDPAAVETNIVMVDVRDGAGTAEDLVAAFAARGVLVARTGPGRVRLVTHRDVGDDGVAACLAAAAAFADRAST